MGARNCNLIHEGSCCSVGTPCETIGIEEMGNKVSGPTKPSAKLTSMEKDLIQQTWQLHVDKDDGLGGRVFDRLFSDSPEMKSGFSHFAEIDVHDEHYNEVLHRHGSRVKSAIGRSISLLHVRGEMRSYLVKLGKRHYTEYNFNPEYIEVMMEYLIKAIDELMGEDWNEELCQAYTKLFSIVTFYLINSMALSSRK